MHLSLFINPWLIAGRAKQVTCLTWGRVCNGNNHYIYAVFGDVFQNSEFLLDEAEEDNEDSEEKHVEDGDKETDKESIDGEKLEKSEHSDSVLKHPSTESTLMLFKDSSSKMG